MRLFTEEEVMKLIGIGQSNVVMSPREILDELIEGGYVHPFDIGDTSLASRDSARAFAEWLQTGEIPQWRVEQIHDQAVGAAVREMTWPATGEPKRAPHG